MHLHLTTVQVIGRAPLDAAAYYEDNAGDLGVPGGVDATWYATGPMQPPDPTDRIQGHRQGQLGLFHDGAREVRATAGATTQTYYHCHILEHEDNDMMRPFTVAG